jgi:hypothetical protein
MPEKRPWSKSDEYILFQGVSIYGIDWFQRKTGRSRHAVVAKARRLFGYGGLTRGAYTLREAARRTGYHIDQLRRAQAALRQKWKRTSPHGSFLIYEEQLEEMVSWLKTDYWNGRHRLYGCLWCDTDRRPHYAVGLCQKCYQRYVQRLHRGGLPLSNAGLLKVVQKNLRSMNAAFLAEAEAQLARGRALAESVLVQLLSCEAVM